MNGKDIYKFATISRISRSENGNLSGYQRPEALSHINEIKEYLESNNAILPNPIEVTSLFKQPKLAKTLFLISRKGKKAFYEGEIAKWIEEDSLGNGGLITLQDLKSYEAKDRKPISINYRGYKIVSMAPVASGGLVLLQIMSILENFNLEKHGPNSAETIHLLSESMQEKFKRLKVNNYRYYGYL